MIKNIHPAQIEAQVYVGSSSFDLEESATYVNGSELFSEKSGFFSLGRMTFTPDDETRILLKKNDVTLVFITENNEFKEVSATDFDSLPQDEALVLSHITVGNWEDYSN